MHLVPSILASSGDAELVKLVFIAIILIIGAVGSLLKKVTEGQRAQTRRTAPPPIPRPLARPIAPITALKAQALPPLPILALPARRTPEPRPALSRPPAPPILVVPARQPPIPPPLALMPPKPGVAPQAPALPVSAIAGMLKPTTVRAQFILAEVLQPPLSLRTRRSF
jgi:hypothetical protein